MLTPTLTHDFIRVHSTYDHKRWCEGPQEDRGQRPAEVVVVGGRRSTHLNATPAAAMHTFLMALRPMVPCGENDVATDVNEHVEGV